MKNKNVMMLVAVMLIIAAAAGGFFGGMMYQKNQAPSFGMMGQNGSRQGGTFRTFGQNGQNSNFRPVRGQVVNMDNSSLTVKMSDGSTKLVVLSQSTAFMQSSKASLSDIKTGDTVNVVGTQNSDGSVTAQDVQINPPQGGFMMRPTGGQQPPTQPTTGAGY